jgi:acyl-CoA thioester hydrolase
MDGYPFSCPIQVRWRDLDAFAHVNNATFATYLEVARTAVWEERFGGREAMDISFFVKRVEIEFKRPLALYDEVRVWLRVGEIRGASFTFEYVVEANAMVAAEAATVLASVDNTTGRPMRMSAEMRTKLEKLQVQGASDVP